MRRTVPPSLILSFLTLFFFVFPYSQIVDLSSYTQPYGLTLAILLVILRRRSIAALPQLDRMLLGSIAVLGLILLVAELPFGLDFREISFFLSYATPLFSTAAAFWIVRRYPTLTRRMLIAAILAWVGVSLIQTLVSPAFLVQLVTRNLELGDNISASGRGVLGLAPEPTHNGFHSLLLGAALALAGGPLWAVTLSVLNAVLLAKSSSAVLALGIGGLLWALRRPLRRFWFFTPIIALPTFVTVLGALLSDESRLGHIIAKLQGLDPSLIMLDFSVNARISGATLPILHALWDFLLPQGISLQRWLDVRDTLLSDYSWVIFLSTAGPASGIGLFLFQGGLLAVPFVLYLCYRLIVQAGRFGLMGITSTTVFAIFLGQFYFSTPTFGLFLAILILRVRSKSTNPAGVTQYMDTRPTTAGSQTGGVPPRGALGASSCPDTAIPHSAQISIA